MRRLSLALTCALGALGCDDTVSVEADFTGITVRTTFPESAGITELHTTGMYDDGTPAFDMGVTPVTEPAVGGMITESLAIVLEAEQTGRDVRLHVDGRDANDAIQASGDAEVRLLLGYFVTSTITLTSDVLCGNGVLDEGELCDDTNRLEGDGCSPGCEPEPDFVCASEPSLCSPAASTAVIDPAAACGGAQGSVDRPYCEISTALQLPWPTTIVLRAGVYDGAVTIDRDVEIIADAGAQLESGTSPALTIDADSVRILGLDVTGNRRKLGGGVHVLGDGAVRLERVGITGSSTVGLQVWGGAQLLLDRAEIRDNSGGGLSLDSTAAYVVENTFIVDNGDEQSEFGGVHFGQSARGAIFANNTVADNQAATDGLGGLRCDAAANVLNTIVWNNGTVTSSVTGACALDYCAVGPVEVGLTLGDGSFTEDPGFVDGPDYHLGSGSRCIDAGDPQSVTDGRAPEVDFDGQPRPQGPNVDIGADEAA